MSRRPAREHHTEGPLLGVDQVPWPPSSSFRLERGELLVVASDGFVEQPNEECWPFDPRLARLDLIGAPDAPGGAPALDDAARRRDRDRLARELSADT
jgi:hypothetical protein